ncbi:hypothetical protein PENPOL_c002G00369 [Penicillium polonicum]|uniref:Uncharacterized protein n=1 Tax=Penicillium polonicum TaxID=60169 RepID=A0A1V6NYD3_PENPO|nr:hypothetical protein PENPOL_c002G00369 [Penicillium polonicum]
MGPSGVPPGGGEPPGGTPAPAQAQKHLPEAPARSTGVGPEAPAQAQNAKLHQSVPSTPPKPAGKGSCNRAKQAPKPQCV